MEKGRKHMNKLISIVLISAGLLISTPSLARDDAILGALIGGAIGAAITDGDPVGAVVGGTIGSAIGSERHNHHYGSHRRMPPVQPYWFTPHGTKRYQKVCNTYFDVYGYPQTQCFWF